jgi:hypothetical protein
MGPLSFCGWAEQCGWSTSTYKLSSRLSLLTFRVCIASPRLQWTTQAPLVMIDSWKHRTRVGISGRIKKVLAFWCPVCRRVNFVRLLLMWGVVSSNWVNVWWGILENNVLLVSKHTTKFKYLLVSQEGLDNRRKSVPRFLRTMACSHLRNIVSLRNIANKMHGIIKETCKMLQDGLRS